MSWVQIGSLLMFLAVALGAFGAHALREQLSGYSLEVYKTAVLYHFFHAMALFVVAWLSSQESSPKVQYAGMFFVAGIMLFSGSLYTLSITDTKWLGAVTPLGGLSFLIGWFLLFIK